MFTNETQKNYGKPAMLSKLKPAMIIIAVTALGMHMQNAGAVRTTPIPVTQILSVEIDQAQQQLIISGNNFGSNPPDIALGGWELRVRENSPNRVVADLPPLLRSANYRLRVSGGHGLSYAKIFNVYVAAGNESTGLFAKGNDTLVNPQ